MSMTEIRYGRRANWLFLFIAMCVLLGPGVVADTWPKPESFIVRSDNGRFEGRVVPQDGELPARVTVGQKSGTDFTEQWTCSLSNAVAPQRAYLTDSGMYIVTLDEYGRLGHGPDVIGVYGSTNGLIARYSLEEAVGMTDDELGKAVSRTVSSIYWSSDALIFFDSSQERELFCLWLSWTDSWLVVSLKDGVLQRVGPGEDPNLQAYAERWVRHRFIEDDQAKSNVLRRVEYPSYPSFTVHEQQRTVVAAIKYLGKREGGGELKE